MTGEINFEIILTKPTPGVDFGLQKGTGNKYETIQKQQAVTAQDLLFHCPVTIKGNRHTDVLPKLSGPFVQGPANGKFIYIDIGTCAGQTNTPWTRRLKIPLNGITWEMIDKISNDSTLALQTTVPGTGKDGGPNCATVKPFSGWGVLRK